MGIFTFNIHESIKEDYIQNLKDQSISLGKMFSIILIIACALLIVIDAILGWTSSLLLFRILPIFFATLYLGYNRFLFEKFPQVFSYIYGLMLLSCIISACGICFNVFTHHGVQDISKLGAVLGTVVAVLICYLFAGIAILSFLWFIGVPLLLTVALIYFNSQLTVVDWMALASPLVIYATVGLLTGEQFFLKTKYFAVQKRNKHQSELLAELKINYKSLSDENIFLIEQLKSNATFDLLTSAFNRGAGLELLEKEFYFAQRNSEPMTLAYIKVDNVEWVNREYGKDFSDKLILSVSQILKETVRKSDLLIRIEDDEFIVVFRQCETRFAKRVIERAQSRAAGLSSQSSFEINFCAGFADSGNEDFSSSKQMLEIADQQMKLEKDRSKFDAARNGDSSTDIAADPESSLREEPESEILEVLPLVGSVNTGPHNEQVYIEPEGSSELFQKMASSEQGISESNEDVSYEQGISEFNEEMFLVEQEIPGSQELAPFVAQSELDEQRIVSPTQEASDSQEVDSSIAQTNLQSTEIIAEQSESSDASSKVG